MVNKLQSYVNGKWTSGSDDGKHLYNAATGESIATASTKGIDLCSVLDYGRKIGSPALRKMTFHQRGLMLKKLAKYLTKRKDKFYPISYMTGATRADSWIDIEGGFGNLFANASLRRDFADQSYHVDGNAIDLSRGKNTFMGHHIMVPKHGVAVHINAFNFPVWGMLEKCAVNWMAGVAAVVKPATATSFLTQVVVKEIIDSNILPEGALQLLCGSARDILDHVDSQDVITFTGSATTGRKLKRHDRLIDLSVPFNMEADSLNCAVLGRNAKPGSPEFDLFVKEVRKEMTSKCGQKCTAIRRVMVHESMVEEVQIALAKALQKVTIGNPAVEGVRMGTLASLEQLNEVRERVEQLTQSAKIVYGNLDPFEVIGGDYDKGAYMSPIVLLEQEPTKNLAVHELEAFGPVATVMPYKDIEEAIYLSQLGKGSLCSSIATYDEDEAREYVLGAASHHGRILALNRDNAKDSTGTGSPLPYLVHGGPGRAGGGEEMGGLRGIKHYMQRCAIQGTPTSISNITGVYQQGSKVIEIEKHPFEYYYDDIKPGMAIKTHKRTITDADIQNFSNLTWDHFYAHTDITSLEDTIFDKRAVHGYFILAAAAGLFVHPNKGPVSANYGLDECRFLRPLYHNDTVYVKLICKEKQDREEKGKTKPAGVVKWAVEVYDVSDELVATAIVLTLVAKKSPFANVTINYFKEMLDILTLEHTPSWGILTPQHMVEHLMFTFEIALGKVDVDVITPKKYLERTQEFLYSHEPMVRDFKHPLLKKGELEDLRFDSLETAKVAAINEYKEYVEYFDEHPNALSAHAIFGYLNKEEWQLLNNKHIHHHFSQFGLIK